MQIRTILLSTFIELDNGVHHGVPVDTLLSRAQLRHRSASDVAIALRQAVQDGDLIESSPGMLVLSQSGAAHYQRAVSAN